MHSQLFRRVSAGLCLALALLLGAAPAGGLVLCIEEDGCVTVALSASAEHCGGCDPHEAADASPSKAAALATPMDECPCADIAVVRSSDSQWRQPRFADAPQPDAFAVLHEAPVRAVEPATISACEPRRVVPRPCGEQFLIRSVVLLV